MSETFSSPIPPPIVMKEYKEILPDAPERILVMAEKQSELMMKRDEHMMKLEDRTIKEQQMQSHIGQIFAFILSILALV